MSKYWQNVLDEWEGKNSSNTSSSNGVTSASSTNSGYWQNVLNEWEERGKQNAVTYPKKKKRWEDDDIAPVGTTSRTPTQILAELESAREAENTARREADSFSAMNGRNIATAMQSPDFVSPYAKLAEARKARQALEEEYSSLYENLSTALDDADTALSTRWASTEQFETEVTKRQTAISRQEETLASIIAEYQKNPSEELLKKYEVAYGQYTQSVEAYESLVGEYNGLVDAYNNAFNEYDSYMKTSPMADQYEAARKYAAVLLESDFGAYSSQGAAIVNPSVQDAEGFANIFGWRPGSEEVGNIVTYSRENAEDIALGETSGTNMVGDPIYSKMTDDEVGIYNYLLAKEGKESAQEYLDFLQETLNARSGKEVAENIQNIKNPIGRFAAYGTASVFAGLDQAASGLQGIASEERLPTSPTQFMSQELSEDLDGIAKYAYTAGSTVGNMLPSIAISAMTGGLGAPAAVSSALGSATLGLSASGNAYNQALTEGYDKKQARAYSLAVGASEATLQYLLGGIGKLGGASTTTLLRKVSKIDSALARVLLTGGVKIGSEITEEELQLFLEPAYRQIIFGEDYDLPEIEEIIETAIVTALSTGVMEGGSIVSARKSEITQNERAVLDALYAEELERRGSDLTQREKDRIYDQLIKDMERGYIPAEKIEEILGGDTYKSYRETVDSEDAIRKEYEELGGLTSFTLAQSERRAELREIIKEIEASNKRHDLQMQLHNEVSNLVSGSRLSESFNERSRRNEDFVPDYDKFSDVKFPDAAKSVLDSAVDFKVTLENGDVIGINNTNRMRDFVEMVARLAGDTGQSFKFGSDDTIKADFIEQQTARISELESIPAAQRTAEQSAKLAQLKDLLAKVESGEVIVDGYNGKEIVINLDSEKPLNSTVGHEVTHSLEKAKAYEALRDHLFAYARSKGVDIDAEIEMKKLRYEGVANADAEAELVADLVGDYLFTDSEYVNRLATENRNLFQRIYDEIKYLCKVVTAGSKEARELERVKKAFEDAYRESGKAQSDTKYSLSDANQMESDLNALKQERTELEEQIDMAFFNDLSDAEVRKLNNRLTKVNADIDKIIAEERKATKRTPLKTVLDNLGKYRRSDLESIAEQLSEGAWDGYEELSRSEIEDGIREIIEEREYSPIKLQHPNFGVYVRDVSNLGDVQYSLSDSADNTPINEITENGLTMTYVRIPGQNTQYYGSTYGQNIEPAGEYMSMDTMQGSNKIDGYEYGTIQFKKPLVIEHINTSDTGWKKTVSDMYNGLTGKKLTRALIKDGYDAIVTYDDYGYSEIVNLNGSKLNQDFGTRFSLSEEVEKTDRFVAVHNKSTRGVLRMLERDGVPFASIAVKRAGTSHEGFGECSIVFPRSTIDPQESKWNKLYSNDAWTPTEPRPEYDVGDTHDFKAMFENMLGTDIYNGLKGSSFLNSDFLERELSSNGGNVFDAVKRIGAVKYGYLQSIGQRPEAGTKPKRLDGFGRYKNDQLLAVFDAIDGETLRNASYNDTAVLEQIADALNEQFLTQLPKRDSVFKSFKRKPLYSADDINLVAIQDAYENWESAGRTIPTEMDIRSLENTLRDNRALEEDADYQRWVEGIFDGLIKDSGIHNGKDLFTPSGNRRSFKQTHVPATLDNIVQQMRKENETGVGTLGTINLRGAATKTYDTVEDMRQDIDKLLGTHIEDDVYKSYMEGFYNRLHELVSRSTKGDDWQARDNAQEILLEAVRDAKTKAAMNTKLRKEAQWINYDSSLADDLWQLKQDVQNMPAPYFEAKPRRVVTPDEAAAYIVPDNAPAQLFAELDKRGLVYKTYKAGDEADRLVKLNSVLDEQPDLRFRLSQKGEAQREYGDFVVYGRDGKKSPVFEEAPTPNDSDAAPVRETVQTDEMFPDDLAPVADIDAQVDRLAQEKAALDSEAEQLYRDYANQAVSDEDFETRMTDINAKWMAVDREIESLKAEDRQRFESLDDADAPPEMDAPYDAPQEAITLTKKAVNDIARTVRQTLGLTNRQMAELRGVIEDYSMEESPDRGRLYQRIEDSFGHVSESEVNEELAEVQSLLRSYKLNVSDHIKSDIADYKAFKDSNFGKIRFSKEGSAVDQAYEELSSMFPGYFPEDITNPADQFLRIVDVANLDRVIERSYDFDEDTLNEAVDAIANGINDFKQTQRQRQAERFDREAFADLVRHADEYAPPDDIAPVKQTPKKPAAQKPETKNGNVAKILTESSAKSGKSGIGTTLVSQLVDKGMVFENLSLETGNMELQSKYNYSLPTNTEARAQYFMEHGADGVQSLKNIMDKVNKTGKTDAFSNYLYHVHNIDRMTLEERFNTPNKTVFGDTVTADVSKREVRQYEKANPEFKEWANDIYEYNKYLRKMLVDGNVISQETSDLWEKMYPHYVPIRRVDDTGLNVNVPLDSRKTGVNAPIKRATGGSSDIEPLFNTMAQRTEQTFRAIARNDFGIELKNTLGTAIANEVSENGILPEGTIVRAADRSNYGRVESYNEETGKYSVHFVSKSGHEATVQLDAKTISPVKSAVKSTVDGVDEMIDTIEAQEDHLLKPGTMHSNPTFTVFENGERVEFEITEDMFDALKPAGKILGYRNKPITAVSNWRRNLLTTWNPVFALYRNPIKDIQEVAINSQHPVKTYTSIPNAIWQMATDGEYAAEYHKNGGKSNTYFDSRKNKFVAEDNIFKKTIGMPLRAIETAGEFIEEIPRLAEYIASRKEGRSVERSMLDAARVTTNFAAGGDFTKFFNSHGFNFLNASVQGASQHVRNFREATKQDGMKGFVKVLAKYTIAGLPGILLNNLLWDDDEEYEELSDYVKQNYYVVAKTEDGKFIRIPKGRTAAVMQNAMEQMQNLVTGDDEVDFGTFYELFMNNIAPSNPVENNILAPIIQTANNETWYGEDLVPSRLQDVPAAEQFDESTDSFSKWFGEALNVSPYKVNYLLDQYSGGLGDVFLPMMTPEAESGDNTLLGNFLAPWKKELTTDSVLNNKNPGDFYDLKDELTVMANAKDATEEDAMRSMFMQSVSWEMSDLYQQKREVQNSDLPDDEKYEEVRSIQEQINALANEALDSYNDVQITGIYSEVGNRRYNYSEENGKWYEIKPTNADGSDNYFYQQEQRVTQGLGISYAEYWNNKEEYDYAYDKPEQYMLSQVVGGYQAYRGYTSDLWDIHADKDENGKSINGSRKTKVIDYINGLDADYYEKIILFKSEYPADDTYNMEIIDYLNSREDISYAEMETILKELGFGVDSQGYITW